MMDQREQPPFMVSPGLKFRPAWKIWGRQFLFIAANN